MRTDFIQALATAGVIKVTRVHTHYCRDDHGCVLPGCKGHHEAKVQACHIEVARNVCAAFNGKNPCQSAEVYM